MAKNKTATAWIIVIAVAALIIAGIRAPTPITSFNTLVGTNPLTSPLFLIALAILIATWYNKK